MEDDESELSWDCDRLIKILFFFRPSFVLMLWMVTLGIPHALTSVMWLCGPIAGLIVQPCVGLSSDKCSSPLGRRRPFILSGCIVISISVIIVGFSSDIGYALGDTKEDCNSKVKNLSKSNAKLTRDLYRDYTGPRYRAAAAFILGFWLLDFSNNTVQLWLIIVIT
uniref:Uncharacterized protein n=1 Tax=Aegilops tauschii TaxID=37682 RepID=M8CEQ8_AEGTA